MTWSDALATLNDSVIATFGEALTLGDGRTLTAVPDLPGVTPEVRTHGAGAWPRVENLTAPALWLHTADAAGLLVGDLVSLRATIYRIERLTPDGTGLTHVELMLPSAQSAPAQGRAWR